MKRLALIFASAISALCALAAGNAAGDANQAEGNAVIEFITTTHNFGTFPEEDGRVSCSFKFVNKGTTDVVLQKVRASCGCTTPDYTKTPVAPGDTGIVNATYNASGRPGAFTKTITVTSNAGEQRLTIKGEVIPKAKKIEDEYPYSIGDLRLKNQNVYLHKINNPKSKSDKLKIYNNGTTDMEITFKNVPAYITVTCSKEKIQPKGEAEITITYESEKSNEWGSVTSSFDIAVNGKVTPNKSINVNATIVEDFSTLTDEQKKNAPVINVGNVINIGEITKGAKKSYKFSVKNDGKDDLIIRRVSCTDETVTTTKPKKAIKAGKSADVIFQIDTEKMKSGEFTKRLNIISNDPNASQKIISVKGIVK